MAEEPQTSRGHYSGSNKVPTVNEFLERLDRGKKDRDRKIEKGQTDEPKAHAPELKPQKGQKTVTDPVTGNQVVIEDAKRDIIKDVDNPKLVVPNANIGKDTPVKTEASQSGREYRTNQDITAPPAPVEPGTTTDMPIHGEKTNILFHPTPSVSYEPMFASLEKQAGTLCAVVLVAIIVLGKMFGASLKGLIPTALCITSGIWLWMKEVVRSGREVEWHSEKERGEHATANLLPESVEWLNTLMGIVWGLINPDMFQGVADTLEDVMQASVPGVIENVRVAEINQGSNPLRILSLRALPDAHMQDVKDYVHEQNKKTKDPQEAAADEEGGQYYNLEVAFAYHALPSGKRISEKARNMHMQLVFYLGIKGLFGVPLPIFVELQGLVGTVRLRLCMTPEPPFLKSLTFTLMGVPQVQAGCIPMIERGVNILNLPLISNFVNYAIGAAASMYVAPKSMMLDMRAMLQGDEIQKDVKALGVLWIRIHRAVGLSKQDKRGSKYGGSDPYITLTFSKYGKPMYCTRVITDDLNPIFEESLALLVTPELIKADENLSVELWDSDRHTADDIVGKIELSLQKMIQHPKKMYPQVSKLAGMDQESEMPGELHWEVGYFSKPPFREALRTDGKNQNLPKKLRDDPQFQDEKGQANTKDQDAVMHTPPDPLWPSGICSVVIHQIVNLELENVKGSDGNRKGREFEPAKPYGENKEETGKNLPTSYCTILFNDELVYRTRSKAVSSQPIFNAGTERFVRDWRSAICTVTVRDQRNREHDPILGVVPLRLSDILDSSCQVTRWYPLDGGIGFGRIRISLLFRSIETQLPPNLLGWDVGTFEFTSSTIVAKSYSQQARIKLRTGGSVGNIPRNVCSQSEDGTTWDLSKLSDNKTSRLPVKYRYRSPVVFEFHLSGKRKATAYAVIWLHHLVDNEPTDIDIPIWTTANPNRLTQNYITERNCSDELGLEDLQEVGRIAFQAKFKAGMDESHETFIQDNDSRETYETWEACFSEGVRTREVKLEMPERVREMHERSLKEEAKMMNVDTIPNDDEGKEKGHWKTNSGTDWSQAFGGDPKMLAAEEDIRRRQHPVSRGDAADKSEYDEFDDDEDEDEDEDSSSSDLGIKDASNTNSAQDMDGHQKSSSRGQRSSEGPNSPRPSGDTTSSAQTDTSGWSESTAAAGGGSRSDINKQNRRTEERKHRGLMQWKPMRNVKFAKNQGRIGMRKLKNRVTGGLDGRQPGVETEVGR